MGGNGRARIQGIVLAGAQPWDDPADAGAFLRPLLPVAHSPLVCYVLKWFRDSGVGRVTICANGSSPVLRRRLRDGAAVGVWLDYYDDPIPRGPAGCARDAAATSDAEVFVVADGTIIPTIDLAELLKAHLSSNAALTVVVGHANVQDGARRGQLTPTGIYVFQRHALEYVSETGYQDTKEVLIPRLHREGELVLTHLSEKPCPRVTSARTYLSVNHWMISRLARERSAAEGYRSIGEGHLHRTARVSPEANLIGPVLVGPETRIGANVTVVGPTVIGAGCIMEERAVVCRSVIWDRCVISRGAIVDQCVLANDAKLAPNEVLRSTMHIPKCAPVEHRGEFGLRRLFSWALARPSPNRQTGRRAGARSAAGGRSPSLRPGTLGSPIPARPGLGVGL